MKLLTNGCSYARGPGSWPYVLANELNCDLVNIALAAAGNTYIHETTINAIANDRYDLVIIMWSGLARIDLKVSNINEFSEFKGTSHYQSSIHDFPEKKLRHVPEETLIEKDWIFLHKSKDYNALPEILKHTIANTDSNIHAYHSLIKMISLQAVLKSFNIKYIFTFHKDYINDLRLSHPNLFAMLDESCMLIDDNLAHIAGRMNEWDETKHPSPTAHSVWAHLLLSKLKNKYNV